MNETWLRVKALLMRRRLDRDLEEEVAFHLAMCEEKHRAGGSGTGDARAAARRQFGNATSLKEKCREMWTFVSVESLWQDIRYGARMLRKNPSFTAVAVFTLALGIGANTTMFTLANAILLRPLSNRSPELVVRIAGYAKDGTRWSRFSYPDYLEYRAGATRSLEDVAAVNLAELLIVDQNHTEQALGEIVSGSYFSILGASIAPGRGLTADDDRAGAPPVAVISRQLWVRRFGGEPSILGHEVAINGRVFTIVGVAAASFAGSYVGAPIEIWLPISHAAQILGAGWEQDRARHVVSLIGWLRPGVTRDQARSELMGVAERIGREYPEAPQVAKVEVLPGTLVAGEQRRLAVTFLSILLATVALVLVVACANVANLSLARAAGRRREISIRFALGASRSRIVRQMLVETGLLAALAGGAGFLGSLWASQAFTGISLLPNLTVRLAIRPDWRVISWTVVATFLATALSSVAAIAHAVTGEVVPSLKEESATTVGVGTARGRLRAALATAQIAVCLLLLIGTALLVRSLKNAESLDLGFDTRHAVALDVDVTPRNWSVAQGLRFYSELLRQVQGLSGVEAAAVSTRAPLDISTPMATVGERADAALATQAGAIRATVNVVSPGFFQTIHTPLLQGRGFTDRDDGSSPVVGVVNQTLAERIWPKRDPVGQRLWMASGSSAVPIEIIGVARNSKYLTPGEEPQPHFYLAFSQHYEAGMTLLVRSQDGLRGKIDAIQSVLRRIDPEVQGFSARTLEEHVSVSLLPVRLAVAVASVVGVLALILAAVGVFGLVSFLVVQRTPEIGLRLALGATPTGILRLIVGYGLRLALVGIGLGLLLTAAVTRLVTSLLYGVSPTDPLVFIAASFVLGLIVCLASFGPAIRAARVDPIVAMRRSA